MIPVIVKRRSNITHRIVYKPKGELWTQELGLETSQSVYAIWHHHKVPIPRIDIDCHANSRFLWVRMLM
jgi:hypothetical protein